MKKRGFLLAACTVGVMLSGCGSRETAFSPSESCVYVAKDGALSSALVEQTGGISVDENELKQYLETAVIHFNEEKGAGALAQNQKNAERLPAALKSVKAGKDTVTAIFDYASFEDLKGKNVAVKNGTQGAAFAESLKDQYGFTTTVFEDSPTMYQDVIQGNSVACVEDKPIIQDWIVSKGLALKTVDAMESDPAPYGFAIMNEANQPLLDMFNAGLADIKANGTYDEILAKYLGESK